MEALEVLLVVLLCAGAIQGITFGIILWKSKGPHPLANRFLAAILFFFSYRLIVETMKIFELGRYDFWYHVLLEYNWIYGPLLYLFVLSYVRPKFKLQRIHLLHFIPVLIEVLWSFFIKSQNFYWDGTRESLSWLGYWGYVVWMHYPTMFVISATLIIIYARKAVKALNQALSDPQIRIIPERVVWIKRVIQVLLVFTALYLIGIGIDYFFFNYNSNLFYGHPVFVGMAAITYWLGLEGFSRRNEDAFRSSATVSEKELEQLRPLAEKITAAMVEQQLYRDPELSVKKLADLLETKSYLITKSLSAVLNTKFNDLVNGYRIEAVKTLLADPKNEQYTLLSLAYEAGFNSKASFNRAVKKITGKSPSALK
ncbi:AraC family transcriptional regulator [Gilvibacter sp. SZ-19]|uniref:helix-turn-helix domain-containing protein n=2 Tax=Gilvibacter TaxID=379070 RepID=UPI000B3C8030|nr:helix-turn-helix domain-containing protein [Gilvibacter sp. SZ-19]ARV12402.1 AraC family transcriptional regulator [Gilvibacter sp. SZ-19]